MVWVTKDILYLIICFQLPASFDVRSLMVLHLLLF